MLLLLSFFFFICRAPPPSPFRNSTITPTYVYFLFVYLICLVCLFLLHLILYFFITFSFCWSRVLLLRRESKFIYFLNNVHIFRILVQESIIHVEICPISLVKTIS
ncbi:hypothetical protein GLYMA_17G261950v4 [Glycine max]|nr:hypothetical protein GLYMA_17G261950v4 [Glycine max]KAH1120246.1 hypothetical protein GYH30_048537 [Glycine max]